MHPGLHILYATQSTTRNALHQALVVLAVAFLGRNPHAHLIACIAARQLALQARDDVAVTVKIGEWLAGGGAVDDRTRVVLQGVMDRDDAVLGDGHWGPPGLG